MQNEQLVELTADIIAAHVTKNSVAVGDLPSAIKSVYDALAGLSSDPDTDAPSEPKKPAVSVRSSVKPDAITCLECGKKQKTLKRHLQTAHGLTPDEYRRDYGLDKNYPMVAPAYAETRSNLAKTLGLGRKKADEAPKRGRAKA